MSLASVCLVAALALAAVPQALWAQSPPADSEVASGVEMVENGEYDRAILTLDNAARRLASDKAKANDLSLAYLYLGIAYIGKGHEAAARSRFREAISQFKDLTLSPDKFPPKVIDAFEAAREEARRGTPAATTAATAPGPEKKKGGGGKMILIVGGLAAAGGAAALAGGGGDSGSPSSNPSSNPSANPPAGTQTLSFMGALPSAGGGTYQCHQVVASRSGTLEARLTWTNPQIGLTIVCQENAPPYTGCTGSYNRTTNTTGVYTTPVTQRTYDICPNNDSGTQDSYTLVVQFP
jgi:hypothetical protein